jgi:hypothetical protein
MLQQTSTLSDIVTRLDTPAQKWPSLVVLVGTGGDAPLMGEVISRNRRRNRCGAQHSVHLELDTATAFSDHPLLIAHGSIVKQIKLDVEAATALCHDSTVCSLQWPVASPAEALNALYCRLIHPFSDVICLFASERQGMHGVAACLESWFRLGAAWTWSATRPRLLVVAASTETRSPEVVQAQLTKLLADRSVHSHTDLFSAISIFVKQSSSQTLRDRIRRETDIGRNIRMQHHTLLNAVHLNLLFRRACEHFSGSAQEPFNLIAASRLHRPVSSSLATHMADLLTHVESYQDLNTYVVPLMAESLVLDNYTYEVHGRSNLSV